MKVNILGVNYEIVLQSKSENPKLENAYGICETYSKKIVIDSEIGTDGNKDNLENIEAFRRKVVRHEIIHAFFHESGLSVNSDYAMNEELVDWIAFQFPKMFKVFAEINVIDVKDIEQEVKHAR